MNKPYAGQPAVNLSALVRELIGQSPGPIAETAAELLVPLSTRLAVIIGHVGFLALFERSLYAASKQHPWLMAAAVSSDASSGFEGLKAALCEQEVREAGQATVVLLSTLLELLDSLIGHALTINLLRASWGIAFEKAAPGIQK